jgi:penicillin-binding protein 2
MLVLILFFLLVLIFRLAQLTLVEGVWRRKQADENKTLSLPIAAQRGILTDRNGVALTQNVPLYRRQIPGTNPAELQFESITRDQAMDLLSNPSEKISYDMGRTYPCGAACAHIIGYLGEATASDSVSDTSLHLGQLIGKTGAERAFEKQLQGVPGTEYLEVNARGKAINTIGTKEPYSGSNITLSIDLGLQQTLWNAFEGKVGAAVALDPQTGEVLALVSTPAYDPASLSAYFKEPNQPFFNRAVAGTYAPGSTFKLVTAVAALEEGEISEETRFQDTGELVIGDYRFGNWLYDEHGRTEGEVNVVKAIARSNDIFFYKAGEVVGPTKLAEWAGLLGLGKTWELSSWGEAAGLVPTPQWKQQQRNERWYLGNTYHMSIGQGDVLATPLQIAVMTGGVATGFVCPPHLVVGDKKQSCKQLNLHETTTRLVREGMVEACQSGGTGAPFFTFSPQVGCKTGTAQQGGEKDEPHAWFTMYAPADNPSIVLTVLVEKGGQGSVVAAPIAKQAMEYWLKK